jgi:hypothetical protein
MADADTAALRARLEHKHDELVGLLHALSKAGAVDKPGGIADQVFRLLGIVTFWQSCPEPSEAMRAQVNRALDSFVVTKVSSHG